MTRKIRIAEQTFEVTEPYAEGHVCTAIEADRLNQVRAENIANNMRKAVKEAVESGNLDQVHADFADYDAKYEFSMPSAGGTRRILDPVEKEALGIARETLRGILKDKGFTVKAYREAEPDKYEAALARLAESDDVLKLAKKRVAEQKKVVETAVDLNI